ncbi:uncharacterized protein LOC122394520 [Amphibalanus amphitrite]|uniref:uncharacterized protein LOC122394520 n=1 Tax=Amphibalanus amphitrite TaxID=1232801 RepID=UPI001C91951F|nr:uncharacterized protein LOC122394520 [Amphibalanus amphitrite]XP_043247392.1 uncharacterized protein LOC122394520 [Amphibalanus amphitrite]
MTEVGIPKEAEFVNMEESDVHVKRQDVSGELVDSDMDGDMSRLCKVGRVEKVLTDFCEGDDKGQVRESICSKNAHEVSSNLSSGTELRACNEGVDIRLPRCVRNVSVPGGIKVTNNIVTVSKRFLYLLSMSTGCLRGRDFLAELREHLSEDGLRAEFDNATARYLNRVLKAIHDNLRTRSEGGRLYCVARYQKFFVQFRCYWRAPDANHGGIREVASERLTVPMQGTTFGKDSLEEDDEPPEFIGPDDGDEVNWRALSETTSHQSLCTSEMDESSGEQLENRSESFGVSTEGMRCIIQSESCAPSVKPVTGEPSDVEIVNELACIKEEPVSESTCREKSDEITLCTEQANTAREHAVTNNSLGTIAQPSDVVLPRSLNEDLKIAGGIRIDNDVVTVSKGYLFSLAVRDSLCTPRWCINVLCKHLSQMRNGLRAELDACTKSFLRKFFQQTLRWRRPAPSYFPKHRRAALDHKYCQFSCVWKDSSLEESTPDTVERQGDEPGRGKHSAPPRRSQRDRKTQEPWLSLPKPTDFETIVKPRKRRQVPKVKQVKPVRRGPGRPKVEMESLPNGFGGTHPRSSMKVTKGGSVVTYLRRDRGETVLGGGSLRLDVERRFATEDPLEISPSATDPAINSAATVPDGSAAGNPAQDNSVATHQRRDHGETVLGSESFLQHEEKEAFSTGDPLEISSSATDMAIDSAATVPEGVPADLPLKILGKSGQLLDCRARRLVNAEGGSLLAVLMPVATFSVTAGSDDTLSPSAGIATSTESDPASELSIEEPSATEEPFYSRVKAVPCGPSDPRIPTIKRGRRRRAK